MQEREATASGLFAGDFVDPTEEIIDMSEGPTHAPVTPPADAPASPSPKPRPRTLSKVMSRGRALSRHGSLSGMMPEPAPLKDNPFTTVPANFNPQLSPQRKGKRKEKEVGVDAEKEREKLPLPAPTSSSVIATEGNTRGGGVVEKIEKKEDPGFVTLDLSLDDLAADAKSSSPRRASRSPPRKKTRS